ncbi:MAG: type II CRISPR-associated endonuclease Cas1 [Spirochaetales bacterium]
MSWRTIVISKSAKLEFELDYLVYRGEVKQKIHLSEIGTLIIESTAVSLTTTLISELCKRKIKVIFCDEKHNPECELIPYYGSHDTSDKIKEQLSWDDEIKTHIWTAIIRDKILKQRNFLFELNYKKEADLLNSYLQELEFGDVTNREGHAAKVYFNAIFGIEFKRIRDDADFINSALNYGYALLLSMFNREIVAKGYLTQLGVWHGNEFNCFNLSCDLMEPFRIVVDKFVYALKLTSFDTEAKNKMLEIFEIEVKIEDKIQQLPNAIKIFCSSIFLALKEKDISLIKYYYEL